LLLAAAATPRKDMVTAVRAVAAAAERLPALHLKIAGSLAETDYVDEVRAACREFGVEDRVEFLGLQGRAEMRRLYAEAQLVLLTSREEVSPMSAIEALAAGIPVVTTRAGGAGYVVEDGRTGRVTPVGDAQAVAAAVVELLSAPALYDEMSRNAVLTSRQRFHPQRVAERYLEIYRTVWEDAKEGAKAR
jgi:glycosyltransferase involved in cell wall biosynthesis